VSAPPDNETMQQVLAQSKDTLPEQVKLAKIVAKSLLQGVKKQVKNFLFGGKFADPAPALRKACMHVSPNNDKQERGFGIIDYRLQKNRNESIETTDSKLKSITNKPFALLDSMFENEADAAWDRARALVPARQKAAKIRREQVSAARRAKIEKDETKGARKAAKNKKSKEEFKAVKVARTPAELDALVERVPGKVALTIAIPEKLAESILRAQIKQWTQVHGVKTKTLPLRRDSQNLTLLELYNKLSAFLSNGDPLAAEAKRQSADKKKAKRGRPKSTATTKAKRSKKRRKVDDEMEWSPIK
jgi:hypothetical protein